jgi:hypothetical protein
MLNNIKQAISKLTSTDVPIGLGITADNDEVIPKPRKAIKTEKRRFLLNGTNEVYVFQRVTTGPDTGTVYIALQHIVRPEELVVPNRVFDMILTKLT